MNKLNSAQNVNAWTKLLKIYSYIYNYVNRMKVKLISFLNKYFMIFIYNFSLLT